MSASSSIRTCSRCGGERSLVRRRPGEGVGYKLACATCNVIKLRKFRAENPGWSTEKNRRWQATNPEKRAAHKAVEKALRVGDLIRKPFCVCGATQRIEAHHDDYSQPLKVMWLCRTHHIARHNELRCADAA